MTHRPHRKSHGRGENRAAVRERSGQISRPVPWSASPLGSQVGPGGFGPRAKPTATPWGVKLSLLHSQSDSRVRSGAGWSHCSWVAHADKLHETPRENNILQRATSHGLRTELGSYDHCYMLDLRPRIRWPGRSWLRTAWREEQPRVVATRYFRGSPHPRTRFMTLFPR